MNNSVSFFLSFLLMGYIGLVYKILVEQPLVLILVVVANIQMVKYLTMGQ